MKSFTERYKHSKEEEQDLIEYFEDNDGDIANILEFIVCSENSDVERFVKFFETQIAQGVLEKSKLFEKSKKNIKLLPDEKVEAKAEKKKIKD